ncbi:ATPase AAA [Desulfosarcina ovata subsp. sediminis]|uniref:ATPase AAA n=1 Tax=Desulfosarcina ovata subsp. sediminis TaxID=885957 RepID=A0A5K7ZKK0_9BACT|nr:sigma-54-dependent Fis family transcriptional regulator [Desulfosarcina ovata]BBO81431.1 ATPase AAA [Desulfosarcina ovata subsp. sediminis]
MNINESVFFREATLRICGSLDIEKAMQRCLQYLSRFLPATRLCFHVYDRALGIVETIAMATTQNSQAMALRTPLDTRGRQQVEDQRSFRTKLVERMVEDAVAGPVVRQLGVTGDLSGLLLDLALEGNFVGTVSVFSEPDIKFNRHHVQLLSLLNEPFSIALANSLRYRELQTLRDKLADDNRYFQDEMQKITGQAVVGADLGLKGIMDMVRQVAPLESPVLLLGETGVGKEVLANAIHNLSPRSNGPMIRVNCGAIPDTLMDSELFGHEKGAFTGAVTRKRGRFERAHRGTVFLDEIGELPLEAQVRLLRVIQEKEIERVGGSETIRIDIRVIAATHRNLERMLKQSTFRKDLYFRLRVFPIAIPPLRHRREDIPALVQHFIQKKSREMKLFVKPTLSPGALDRLLQYTWPGNARELENAIERELIVCKGGVLSFDDLNVKSNKFKPVPPPPCESSQDERLELDAVMAGHIGKVLKMCNGRVEGDKGAARLLNINPSTLRKRMKKLGIPFGRRHVRMAREGVEHGEKTDTTRQRG